jgi:deoxyadenosine/deoxycytidine kinase
MILFLNGAFGVGKTTVGHILRKRIAKSIFYNPEWTGSILMRFPMKIRGAGTDDFQDIDLWRKSVINGVRIFRKFAPKTVIVPMALCRRDYFDEIMGGLREFDNELRLFCLQASFETILIRLKDRGEKIDNPDSSWTLRKAKECIESHKDGYFGETIDTNEMNAFEVADEILMRLSTKCENNI